MKQIFESLKGLINHEMISKAADAVEENKSSVSTATSSVIAGLLAVISKNGATPQLREILEEAGNLDILSDIGNAFEEKPSVDQQKIGDNLLQHILGDKAATFTDPIAEHSGITKVAVNKLVSITAPLVAGFLGRKMTKDGMSLHQVINEIDDEKADYAKYLPAGLIQSFGLPAVKQESVKTEYKPVETKKSKSWIIWVVILALLLLLFLLWRSCGSKSDSNKDMVVTEQEEMIVTEEPTATETKTLTELTLPNGEKINAYPGGVEDQMIKFLQSDEYKNATADDLKNKWFTFDNVEFQFDSATQLKEGSQTQLNNITAILKCFKDAKVKIGAYTDKVGSEDANKKISTERAQTIESLLKKGGIESQITGAEGYGDEFAKHAASESDDARAQDRNIALRFVK